MITQVTIVSNKKYNVVLDVSVLFPLLPTDKLSSEEPFGVVKDECFVENGQEGTDEEEKLIALVKADKHLERD